MANASEKKVKSKLKVIKKTKLHEKIINQIQSLIDNGRLKYGDQLPPERELTNIFKVSRHTVREAILSLEVKKILKSRPGSGTFVILEDEATAVDFLAKAIHREKNTLSEIFQFRELIEPQIAGLAAQNATPEDILKLENILEQQQIELDNTMASKNLDEKFHFALSRATGNSVLLQVIKLLNNILLKSRDEHSLSPRRNKLSLKGHQHILDAIKKGDSKTAKDLMVAHLKGIRELIV
jgi:GntR family transcriptional regulator, transcriptional repressor for pyruvate dehydrogenase complex